MVTGSRIINHILVFPGLLLGHHLGIDLLHLKHRGVRDIQWPSLIQRMGVGGAGRITCPVFPAEMQSCAEMQQCPVSGGGQLLFC